MGGDDRDTGRADSDWMLMSAETEAPAQPELLEAGRYKAFQAPDGSWVLARATGTCAISGWT